MRFLNICFKKVELLKSFDASKFSSPGETFEVELDSQFLTIFNFFGRLAENFRSFHLFRLIRNFV